MVVYTTLNNRRAASGPFIPAASSATSTTVSTASTVAVSAGTSTPALLPSEAAPAAWAGLLRRLVVEPLHLLRRGGRRAPAGHGVLSCWGLIHSPHVGALLRADHQAHGGSQGGFGTVVNRPPGPVHAQELDCRVLEQCWQPLQCLVDPCGYISNGSGEEMTVLTSWQSANPRLQQHARGCP